MGSLTFYEIKWPFILYIKGDEQALHDHKIMVACFGYILEKSKCNINYKKNN